MTRIQGFYFTAGWAGRLFRFFGALIEPGRHDDAQRTDDQIRLPIPSDMAHSERLVPPPSTACNAVIQPGQKQHRLDPLVRRQTTASGDWLQVFPWHTEFRIALLSAEDIAGEQRRPTYSRR